MLAILATFLLVISSNSALREVCKNVKAFVHHDIEECIDLYINRRNTEDLSYYLCPNEGTWTNEYFNCTMNYSPRRIPNEPYCTHGKSLHMGTCAPEVLKTAEMWFIPNGDEIIIERKKTKVTPGDTDWEWGIMNLRIWGNDGHISIYEPGWWGSIRNPPQSFYNVYDYSYNGNKTYLAITLDYNSTCHATVKIYINGSLVIETDRILDHYFLNFIRTMFELNEVPTERDEIINFIGAWNIVASDEQIAYLYTLGSNRGADTVLIACEEMDIEGSVGGSIWQILFWAIPFPLLLLFAASIIGTSVLIYRRNLPSKRPLLLNESV